MTVKDFVIQVSASIMGVLVILWTVVLIVLILITSPIWFIPYQIYKGWRANLKTCLLSDKKCKYADNYKADICGACKHYQNFGKETNE